MSEDALNFLNRNNINLEALKEGELDNIHHILRPYNINRIIKNNQSFYRESEKKNVSIADILGYDDFYCREYYFLESLSSFFDSKKDSYHQRSVSMLTYQSEEVIDKLSSSFIIEPIKTRELDKDKYIISTNGLHRFTILKCHYLIEYEKSNKTPEDIATLNEKYTIPVINEELDYIKTYSVYILDLIGIKTDYRLEYDEKFCKTGNLQDYQNDKKVITDQEIVALANEFLSTHLDFLPLVKRQCVLIPSFKKYISENMPWVLEEPIIKEEKTWNL